MGLRDKRGASYHRHIDQQGPSGIYPGLIVLNACSMNVDVNYGILQHGTRPIEFLIDATVVLIASAITGSWVGRRRSMRVGASEFRPTPYLDEPSK